MVRSATASATPLPAWAVVPGALLSAQQQWMLRSSLAWFDLLAMPWQAATRFAQPDGEQALAVAWPALPEATNRALVQAIQFWWSPWTPFLLRGGEQLA